MSTEGQTRSEVPAWADYSQDAQLSPVLRHALDAFVEDGYHATTVRDLARRLGQTVPAIYYHYQNKQAVLVALLSLAIDDLLWRVRQAAAEAPDDPLARLGNIVRCLVLFVAYRQKLAFLDGEIRSLEPDNRAEYVARRDEVQNIVDGTVQAGMDAGVFADGDAHAIARAILTMCRGIVIWFRPDGPMSPEAVADLYVTLSLRLAGADPASVAAPRSAPADRRQPAGVNARPVTPRKRSAPAHS
jgi:AcrR family transcriptional regulator